jgi:hypothetical protein
VKVLDSQGLGLDSDVINGVVYATTHGANVILMSFSNPGYSSALQTAINYAWSHGVVLVAATGNDNGSSTVNYPAGDKGVIGVGSTGIGDTVSSFSNTGADVFLAAPGENILSTSNGGGYVGVTGTSASAAAVAGAAALIKASSVGATNGVIVNRLAESADAVGTASQTGNGRLNLYRAINDTSSTSIEPAGAGANGGPFVGPYTAAAAPTEFLEVWGNTNSQWNGTDNGTNSAWKEGQSVPARYRNSFAAGSTHTVILKYDFNNGTKHFVDALTNVDRTVTSLTTAQICVSVTCSGSPVTASIPPDTTYSDGSSYKTGQEFRGWNVSSLSVLSSAYSGSPKTVTVRFTVASGSGNKDVVLAYGLHLARENEWGIGNGVINFPGGSGKAYSNLDGASSDVNAAINPSTAIADAASIQGKVYNDANGNHVADAGEGGISGVTVSLSGSATDSATTQSDGSYSFSGLDAGTFSVNYTVPAGYANTGPVPLTGITVAQTQTSTGNDFFAQGIGTIGGFKWSDADGDQVVDSGEAKLNGWVIQLCSASGCPAGTVVDTQTTAGTGPSTGNYQFIHVAPGSYFLREVLQSNWTQTTPTSGEYAVTLNSGNGFASSGNNFGNKTTNATITFNETGIAGADTGATGVLSVTIGSTTTQYNAADFPVQRTVAVGTSVSYTYNSPIGSSTTGKRYVLSSGPTPVSPQTVNSSTSVTATYGTQYQLSLATSPLAVGTSNISGLAAGGWYNDGATATVTATQDVANGAGSRYHFSAWSGASTATTLATSVTMDAPKSLTAGYLTQYQLSLATNPAAVASSNISGGSDQGWYDGGTALTLTAIQDVGAGPGTRYDFRNWSGDVASPPNSSNPVSVTMNQARSITANYQLQYQLSLATNPAAVGTTHISGASDGQWFNSGATASVTADQDVAIAAGSRYHFSAWSGASTATTLATSVTMDAPKSLTAGYRVQYSVTFAATGLDSSATGVVVTVNGGPDTITASDLPADRWVDSGGSISYAYTDPVTSSTPGKQFSKTSGPVPASPISNITSSKSVTAGYGDRYPTTVTNLTVSAKSPNTLSQYSDTVTLSATVNATNTSSGPLSGTVTFKLNGKPITPALTATVSGNAPQVVTADLLLSTTIIPSGSGNYSLTADFAPASGSKYLPSNGSSSAQIQKEDTSIEYSGDTLKATSTTASNSTATVDFAAVIREAADGSYGDKLNTTQLKFTAYKYSDTAMTTPVATCTGNVASTGTGTGSAGCSVTTLTADNYVVKIELLTNGYYVAPVEDQALTVVNPGTGFTTGGGWLTETNLGSRSNFGFTVKYLKNLNVQGNSLYIYRKVVGLNSVANPAGGFLPAGQYNWIIKSNAMGTLTQTCTSTAPKVCAASFEGKNNITAVSRATGVAYSLGGNYNFHVDVTDNSEPGSSPGAGPDTYTIRVWDSTTGDYYKLPGFPTQTKIDGGNIQVRP